MAAQPTGHTLQTTHITIKEPFLLKMRMREYQLIGLDWLVTIYKKRLNGILADEMGLGKTIQAIALLAHLACEEGVWGPHLIVVPTSVMLNWEMEFKKWCPAFKLLTYYGTAKERKAKRQGWSKPNAFHVCITSYTLVLQDAKMFRRKRWRYLILDEAHMIKNWKSQRWQTLLRFNSKRRLLITGTPLQNDLMELWSLMHFLMPDVFSSHNQFRDWFCNPLTGMVEGSEAYNKGLVERLHGVLRPFLLRRLKSEVERQMPGKHEHVVYCRLSKRQRKLYDEYMAASETQATLASGNFMGVVGVLMQLRKVCNHPDLFEGRPIVSAFDMPPLERRAPSAVLYGMIPPPLYEQAHMLLAEGLALAGLGGEGAGSSPVVSRARGLLLGTAGAVAAPTAWDAARVEELQVTYPLLAAMCLTDNGQQSGTGAVFSRDDPDPLVRTGTAQLEVRQDSAGAALGAVERRLYADYTQVASSNTGLKVLAGSLAAQYARHSQWRESRLRATALVNLTRCCAGAPLYGLDVLGVLSGLANTSSKCLNTDTVRVTDSAWEGPSAASAGVWDGEEAAHRLLYPGAPTLPTPGAAGTRPLITELPDTLQAPQGSGVVVYDGGVLLPPPAPVAPSGFPATLNPPPGGQGPGEGPYQPVDLRACQAKLFLPSLVTGLSCTYEERAHHMEGVLREFKFYVPKARGSRPVVWCARPDTSMVRRAAADASLLTQEWYARSAPLHTAAIRGTLFFPDRRLIQFDCGKLQEMDGLLRRLKKGGHRCLIFTQMTKMLDVLEVFLNLHGHTYMRLDGSTKPEARQIMMQRFNTDPRTFCFILSTRSGGVGITLTGADTVIFYDSDWNPAMDQQAQDRCHRIGQTREVHIYRLVSENTIEENILRKSDQKRQLDWLAIQSGGFNTDILTKLNINDFFKQGVAGAGAAGGAGGGGRGGMSADDFKAALRGAEDEADADAAMAAEKEEAAEMDEFTKDPPPTAAAKPGEEGEGEDEEGGGDDADDKDGPTAKTPKAGSVAPGEEGAEGGEGGDGAGGANDAALVAAAAQVAGGATADDVLARLDASLTPIEKYAVRFLEEQRPVDVEAAAAAAVANLGGETDWQAEEMARRKEEAEAASDSEELAVEDWDTEQATAEYRALADQARRELEEIEALEAAAAEEAAQMAAEAQAQAAAHAEMMAGAYGANWDVDAWGAADHPPTSTHPHPQPGVSGFDPSWFTAQLNDIASKLQLRAPSPLPGGAGGVEGTPGPGPSRFAAASGYGGAAPPPPPALPALGATPPPSDLTAPGATGPGLTASGRPKRQKPNPPSSTNNAAGLGSADSLSGLAGSAPFPPYNAAPGAAGTGGVMRQGSAQQPPAHVPGLAIPPASYEPWNPGLDALLMTVVDAVVSGQHSSGAPATTLAGLQWVLLASSTAGAAHTLGLNVPPDTITPARCQARFALLLAAAHAAHLPLAPLTAPPPRSDLIVRSARYRIQRLFSHCTPDQQSLINVGLGKVALPGFPGPQNTPLGLIRQRMAELSQQLTAAGLPAQPPSCQVAWAPQVMHYDGVHVVHGAVHAAKPIRHAAADPHQAGGQQQGGWAGSNGVHGSGA